MGKELLRDRLNNVIKSGLTAKSISLKTGIATDILSRYKNGHIGLTYEDAEKLNEFLDKVIIP